MSFRKISRNDLLASCSQPGPDDGRDPRLDRREGSGKVPNRKALQLCAQVARTLASVFAECADDVLRDLVVESVVPAPNASRLLVSVAPAIAVEAGGVAERLQQARGKLRGEVTAAINRRRMPDLVFHVADPPR
jgi:ribosome-binding factor A